MSSEIIKAVGITKRFGKKTVLNDINLEITSGEVFGIIGMSGSGKTTLLNTMIGFLQPEAGDIQYKLEHLLNFANDEGQFRSVFNSEGEVKRTFGFATQTPSLYSKLTCVENLEYFGKLYNLNSEVRNTNMEILLKLMGIYEARNLLAGNLSGGMLKRLDIACALIHDPKVLILDEPTADLDPILRKQMWSLIKQINQKGTTIILSSHFLDELELLCDRVGILLNGKIISKGTPNEVKNFYSRDQEIQLETTPGKYKEIIRALHPLEHDLSITRMEVRENKLVVYTTSPERSLHKILHVIEDLKEIMIDVIVEKPSLQEVLEQLEKKH